MKEVYLTDTPAAKLLNCFYKQFFFKRTRLIKSTALLIVCLLCQPLFAQPVITSFSPLSGLPGSTVTINGSGFSSMPVENIVLVGGTRAHIIAASANKLKAQVPRGITTKPISVTVNHLTGFSSVPYITTYKTGSIFSPGTFATPQNF